MTAWIDWSATGATLGAIGTLFVAMWVAYRVGQLHAVAAEQAEARERKSKSAA